MGADGPPEPASVSDATGLLLGVVLASAGEAVDFCAVVDSWAEGLAAVGDLAADDDGLAALSFEPADPEEGVDAALPPPGNTTSEHE
jgi:hypothetical protein